MENTAKPLNQNYLIGAIIAALIIGFVAGWFWPHTGSGTNSSTATASSSANKITSTTGNALTVLDQPPGDQVIIDHLTLANPGWVVIYTTDDLGQPGRIMSAQYFDRGDYHTTKMTLLEGTLDDETYWAILHSDDGLVFQTQYGSHPFDYTKDLPLTDASGKKIGVTFKAVSGGSRGEY